MPKTISSLELPVMALLLSGNARQNKLTISNNDIDDLLRDSETGDCP